MTQRESALATLAAIASSPDAVAASQAHFFAALDAVVTVYMTTAPAGMPPRLQAMRSPRATWCAVVSHAEHRVHNLKAAEQAAKASA